MTTNKLQTLFSYLIVGIISVSLAWSISAYFLKSSSAENLNSFKKIIDKSKKEIVIAQNNVPPPPSLPNQQTNVQREQGESVRAKDIVESMATDDLSLFLEGYNYDPQGRRDPFMPLFTSVQETGEVLGPRTPLESYSLEEFKLIGVIWGVHEPKAMFMDPNKKIHFLTKDQRIGKNQGYIAVIREGEVVVVEAVEKDGEPVYTAKVIKINN